jgi:uncharacterized membrane protein (DUF485 family)
MVRKLPKWFWYSLIIFYSGQWLAIPILNNFVNSARDIVLAVIIITAVFYPVFFIIMMFVLRKKNNLNKEELMVPGMILLLPLLLYVPIFVTL